MTAEENHPPYRHQTAQAVVAGQLRYEILSGHILPGTRLIQSEVAKRLGMSTTPVREAMRELVAEGLLEGDAHKGLFVHQPTLPELVEVYEIRLLLEPANVELTALRVTDTFLDQAERLLAEMEATEDIGRWVELNREFHRILTEASGNTRMIEILRNLRNVSSLYVGIIADQSPARLATANDEHKAILDACRSRDAAVASRLVKQHVQSSLNMLRDLLAESDDAER